VHVNIREIVGASIAVITICAFLFIVVFDVVKGQTVTLPDALLVLVSLVSGVYLGQHAATNGAYQAGVATGTSAANIANATTTPNVPKVP
jgi:uncharacterized membrane protein YfcA